MTTRVQRHRDLFRLPLQHMLLGNPRLPGLQRDVIAGFAKTVSTLHLIRTLPAPKFPKGNNFWIKHEVGLYRTAASHSHHL